MFLGPRVCLPHQLSSKVGRLKPRPTPNRYKKLNRSQKPAPLDDAVSDSEVTTGEENLVYAEEEPHMLPMTHSGGFCPVTLGETLPTFEGPGLIGGNFKIVRKLGWGTYSTVWLAESQGCVDPCNDSLTTLTHPLLLLTTDARTYIRDIKHSSYSPWRQRLVFSTANFQNTIVSSA